MKKYTGTGTLYHGNQMVGRVTYDIRVIPIARSADTLAGPEPPVQVSEKAHGSITFLDTAFFPPDELQYVLKLKDGTPVRIQVGPYATVGAQTAPISILVIADLPQVP